VAASDEHALLLKISADVSGLQKQMNKAVGAVDSGSSAMERRAKAGASALEKAFAAPDLGKALDKVFESTRFKALDSGVARVGIFGGALEHLGAVGLGTAAAVGALALAFEGVKKAMEEVGQLKVLADQRGLPIEALQELQFAAKESHVPVEALNAALLNLNDILGRLRTGIGAARLQKLAETLGITPADLAGVKTAADLLPILADRIRALPSLSDQYAAAAKANVAEILPLLLKGGDGVRELMAEYRSLGVEVGGNFANSVAAGNLEMERAHDIAHDKLRNSLLELHPLVVGLSTAWDGFAAHAIDALNATTSAYDRFVQRAKELANQRTGNPFTDFGANALGRFNLAIARPTTALAALAGFPGAQQEALYGPGGRPSLAGPAPLAASRATGPTPAQLAAELVAKQKLDELEAKYLTHTTNRLEAERKIEEINAKRAAAGDRPLDADTQRRILAAASAQDAKPAQRASDAAERRREAAQRKAQEQTDRQIQLIDAADKEELAARLALTTDLKAQAALRAAEIDADTKKKNAKADADLAEGKIDQATRERVVIANNITAVEKKQLLAKQTADQLAQQSAQREDTVLAGQEELLKLQDGLALTAAQRRDLELKILDIADRRAQLAQEEILASQLATDAQKQEAQLRLDQLAASRDLRTKQVLQGTDSPLGRYLQENSDAGVLTERNSQTFAEGLDNLASGLADAALNTHNFGKVLTDTFGKAAMDFLANSLRQFLASLANSAISGSSGSGIGGFIASIFGGGGGGGAGVDALAGLYASGTDSAAAGLVLVGRTGPGADADPRRRADLQRRRDPPDAVGRRHVHAEHPDQHRRPRRGPARGRRPARRAAGPAAHPAGPHRHRDERRALARACPDEPGVSPRHAERRAGRPGVRGPGHQPGDRRERRRPLRHRRRGKALAGRMDDRQEHDGPPIGRLARLPGLAERGQPHLPGP
jgi:hypothetical protein